MKQNDKKQIWFIYALPISFSGQWAASELIIENLVKKGWKCLRIPYPSIDRGINNPFQKYFPYFIRLLRAWLKFCSLVFVKKPVIYINLGQSMLSFFRMGIPFIFLCLLRSEGKIVISLHGSIFMTWDARQIEARIFRIFLHYATYITVLGPNQKERLCEFGVSEKKIIIVPNTCELNVLNQQQVFDKHQQLDEDQKKPLQILHLSLLLESKGYPEVLETFEILSKKNLRRTIKGIICGPIHFSAFCTRFTSEKTKTQWIYSKISNINQSEQVSVKWINGASGKNKERLFRDSHIFIFPSKFPVEAQPLVLLEAMASGCTIITTKVGEIPSTLSNQTAIFLDDTSPEHIANVIENLMEDTKDRILLAQAGIQLLNNKFSIERYASTWDSIFTILSA